MVIGLGIDMIEVERVAAKINKNSGFREMLFSRNEIAYCEGKANKFEHYAARFAAKEAFFKALGTGWSEGTSFSEVEVTNTENGQPQLSFSGNTANIINAMHLGNVLVSLTHLKSMASAVVIIEI